MITQNIGLIKINNEKFKIVREEKMDRLRRVEKEGKFVALTRINDNPRSHNEYPDLV